MIAIYTNSKDNMQINIIGFDVVQTSNPERFSSYFLDACYATLHPALSVGQSVGQLVGRSHFFLCFLFFDHTTSARMLWWPQIWPLPTRTQLG